MKNGFELASERMLILYQLEVKLNELAKVENNIADRERLERDIDILEEKLHNNKKLLEELK